MVFAVTAAQNSAVHMSDKRDQQSGYGTLERLTKQTDSNHTIQYS